MFRACSGLTGRSAARWSAGVGECSLLCLQTALAARPDRLGTERQGCVCDAGVATFAAYYNLNANALSVSARPRSARLLFCRRVQNAGGRGGYRRANNVPSASPAPSPGVSLLAADFRIHASIAGDCPVLSCVYRHSQ